MKKRTPKQDECAESIVRVIAAGVQSYLNAHPQRTFEIGSVTRLVHFEVIRLGVFLSFYDPVDRRESVAMFRSEVRGPWEVSDLPRRRKRIVETVEYSLTQKDAEKFASAIYSRPYPAEHISDLAIEIANAVIAADE